MYLGKRLDDIAKTLDRMTARIGNMNQFTACGKKIKSKKVIHGND